MRVIFNNSSIFHCIFFCVTTVSVSAQEAVHLRYLHLLLVNLFVPSDNIADLNSIGQADG